MKWFSEFGVTRLTCTELPEPHPTPLGGTESQTL